MTWFEQRDADWLAVDEAVRRITSSASPLPARRVELRSALGMALSNSLAARATLPPFDNSAMDGYAVLRGDIEGASEDEPARLRVRGQTLAGDPPADPLSPGQAVRIMTGAPVPGGTDTVVRVEHTDAEKAEEGVLHVFEDSDAGRHVRPAGQDMRAGDVVLRAGTAVTPGVIAVAAALGHAEVDVHRRPRVGVLSSGDEVYGASEFEKVIAGRGVPDTNGPSLAAAVEEAGCEPVRLGVARDDPDDIRKRVERARTCDALVTTGGASMGEADLFKRALAEMGLRVHFWRVKIRPGSPFSFGELPRSGEVPLPVLGLPGNPTSAFVTFQVFARPFLLKLAGHSNVHRRVVRAVAGERFPSTPRLTHFHRVVLQPATGPTSVSPGSAPVARLTGPQGSGLVRSLGVAHGLAVVPEGVAEAAPGDPVDVLLLDDAPASCPDPAYGSRPG